MQRSTHRALSTSVFRHVSVLSASSAALCYAVACAKQVPDEHVKVLAVQVATTPAGGWGGGSSSSTSRGPASHAPSGTNAEPLPGNSDSDAGGIEPSGPGDASLPGQPNPETTSVSQVPTVLGSNGEPVTPDPSTTHVTPGATEVPTSDVVSTSAPISSIAASVPVPIPTASSDVPNTTPSSTPPSEYNLPFTKANLLTAISVCALESYREFKAHAEELELVSSEFAASPDGDHVQIARESWLTAVASWQRAEPFRFGPAARSSEPGGLNLRDQIYVFPLANYCKVDQQIVDRLLENRQIRL